MCDGTSVSDECWRQVVKPEFDYYASCLGKFTVKKAIVWECSRCGAVTLLASICKGWEIEKAIEIIEVVDFASDVQMRFIREVCGKTKEELAVALDVPLTDVKRWEIGHAQTSEFRMLSRYFLRQEGRIEWIPCERRKRIEKKVRMETED